ncbi:MAG: hypothetical protein V4532_14360 [Pseudomonadota bacterium]
MGVLLLAVAVSRLGHNVENVSNHESLVVEFSRDFMLGVAYVIALVSASRMVAGVHFEKLHQRLAGFSYTTYLCHFPLMLFLTSVGDQVFGLPFQVQPGVYGLSYFLGLSIILYLWCYMLSTVTESHTLHVKAKLDFLMGKFATPSKALHKQVS